MTVKFAILVGESFQGLSTDDKPMSVLDGASFRVIDTGEMYRYHDFMWELDLGDPVTHEINKGAFVS